MRAMVTLLAALAVTVPAMADERLELILRTAARVVLLWDDGDGLPVLLDACVLGGVESTYDQFPNGALGAIALAREPLVYKANTVAVVQHRGVPGRATVYFLRCP